METFSCFVFTTDRRLLLTMRGHAKTICPDVWANSCYGQAEPGEPLEAALARTLRDELGLTAAADLILPEAQYGPVYRVVTDERPRPDPAHVGDFEWVGWKDFVEAVATGDVSVSPWCAPQVGELAALGDDPAAWPVCGSHQLYKGPIPPSG